MFVNLKIFYLFKMIHKKILGKKKFNHAISELAATLEIKKLFISPATKLEPSRGGECLGRHSTGLQAPWDALPAVALTRALGQGCPASTLLQGKTARPRAQCPPAGLRRGSCSLECGKDTADTLKVAFQTQALRGSGS